MALLTIAYPEISDTDFTTIQQYRKTQDGLYYSVVAPHFTFVFPVEGIEENLFIQAITERAADCKKIDFVLRCATINKDAFSDYFHTFLVPDEGFSGMVKLHDRLYSGLLKEHLRLDLDFIPHIGIGNTKDSARCKQMVDEWNKRPFEIPGTISRLTIVKYEDAVVTAIKDIELC